MDNKDIRWMQRFYNYRKALAKLCEAGDKIVMTDLEQEGLIKRFEYTYELAWKTLQDLLREKGSPNSNGGPSVIIKQAFTEGYIASESQWKELKTSREMTSHTYNDETANEIAENIVETYIDLFLQLETRLQLEKLNQEKQG